MVFVSNILGTNDFLFSFWVLDETVIKLPCVLEGIL